MRKPKGPYLTLPRGEPTDSQLNYALRLIANLDKRIVDVPDDFRRLQKKIRENDDGRDQVRNILKRNYTKEEMTGVIDELRYFSRGRRAREKAKRRSWDWGRWKD